MCFPTIKIIVKIHLNVALIPERWIKKSQIVQIASKFYSFNFQQYNYYFAYNL